MQHRTVKKKSQRESRKTSGGRVDKKEMLVAALANALLAHRSESNPNDSNQGYFFFLMKIASNGKILKRAFSKPLISATRTLKEETRGAVSAFLSASLKGQVNFPQIKIS